MNEDSLLLPSSLLCPKDNSITGTSTTTNNNNCEPLLMTKTSTSMDVGVPDTTIITLPTTTTIPTTVPTMKMNDENGDMIPNSSTQQPVGVVAVDLLSKRKRKRLEYQMKKKEQKQQRMDDGVVVVVDNNHNHNNNNNPDIHQQDHDLLNNNKNRRWKSKSQRKYDKQQQQQIDQEETTTFIRTTTYDNHHDNHNHNNQSNNHILTTTNENHVNPIRIRTKIVPLRLPRLPKQSSHSTTMVQKQEQEQQQERFSNTENNDIATTTDIDNTTDDWIIPNGPFIRLIEPYVYTFISHCKQRWIGRTILDVYQTEFGCYDSLYYHHAITSGRIYINDHDIVTTQYILKNTDILCHTVHRHEPAIAVTTSSNRIPITTTKSTTTTFSLDDDATTNHHSTDNNTSIPPSTIVDIVANTPDVLVIDKPGTMPIHPCGGYHYNSLVPLLESLTVTNVQVQVQQQLPTLDVHVDSSVPLPAKKINTSVSNDEMTTTITNENVKDKDNDDSTTKLDPCSTILPTNAAGPVNNPTDPLSSSPQSSSSFSSQSPQQSSSSTQQQQQLSSSLSSSSSKLLFGKLYTVHRLDRLTSGLVIFGKNKNIAQQWGTAIQDREQCEKLYVTRVKGKFLQQQREDPGNIPNLLVQIQRQQQQQTESEQPNSSQFDTRTIRETECSNRMELPQYGEWKYHSTDHVTTNTTTTTTMNSKTIKNQHQKKTNMKHPLKKKRKQKENFGTSDCVNTVGDNEDDCNNNEVAKTAALLRSQNAFGYWITDHHNNNNYNNTNDVDGTSDNNVISTTEFASIEHSVEEWLEVIQSSSNSTTQEMNTNKNNKNSGKQESIVEDEKVDSTLHNSTSPTTIKQPFLWYHLVCPVRIQDPKNGVCVADGSFPDVDDASYIRTVKAAHTMFAILQYNEHDDTTLLLVKPVTGRTHQIRIHLQFLQYPIANDPNYGGKLWFHNPLGEYAAQQAAQILQYHNTQPTTTTKNKSDADNNDNDNDKDDSGNQSGHHCRLIMDEPATVNEIVSLFQNPVTLLPQQPNETLNQYYRRTCVWCARIHHRHHKSLLSKSCTTHDTITTTTETTTMTNPHNKDGESITTNTAVNQDSFMDDPCVEQLYQKKEEDRAHLEFLLRSPGLWLHALQYTVKGTTFRTKIPVWCQTNHQTNTSNDG